MPVNLTVGGTTYAYPVVGDQLWGTAATNWAIAVTNNMLQKSGGNFTLTADVNFGANYGLLSAYFSTRTANPAGTGVFRLAVSDVLAWRNNANNANLSLAVNGSDQLTFAGSVLATLTGGKIPASMGGLGIDTSASTGVPKVVAGTWSVVSQLPETLGGTNQTSYTQGDTLYASASNTLSKLAKGTALQRFRMNSGATAPEWVENETLSVVSKTTTYTTVATDDVVLASTSGGAWTLSLISAASVPGKRVTIKKTTSDLSALTIDPAGAETIDGASTTTLNTLNETIFIVSDGTNWQIVERRIPTTRTSFTPTGSWSANVTYTGYWWRRGKEVEIEVKIAITGTPTNATLTVNNPSGITFDTSEMVQADSSTATGLVSSASHAAAGYKLYTVYNSSTSCLVAYQSSTTGAATGVGQTAPVSWANGSYIIVRWKGPVSGWKE